MDLILWRHAEAEAAAPGQTDLKRRLTIRGEKQAHDMAQWLSARLPKKCRVLVSPALRTQQTAHTLALPFEIDPTIGPAANASNLIAATQWPGASATVLLVGHQPTLGNLAALLLTGNEAEWSIKKGAIWWFAGRPRDGREHARLRAVINPDMLR
jgi:phosphohistidine phosphatase